MPARTKHMVKKQFSKHNELPFAECRYTVNSGRHYTSHMHQSFSVGAISKGEVVYTVADEQAHLRPGSLAIINPETLHSCNPTALGERSYYMLYLDVDWCLQVQKSLWGVSAFRKSKDIILEHPELYEQYISTMALLMDNGEELDEKEQRLVDLVSSVFIQCCEREALASLSSGKIDNLRQRLQSDLGEDLPLDLLATELQANPYTLLRQFKAATTLTPHAYRLNCRIEYARKLLREGRELADVALECGFFDQSHFHRHFKGITTLTPKEYQVNFIQ